MDASTIRTVGWAACASLCLLLIVSCDDKPPPAEPAAQPAGPQAPNTRIQATPQSVAAAPEALRPSDGELAARVKNALEADPGEFGQGIDVTAAGGAVRLWGTVASRAARSKAEKIASSVPGVNSVENKIVVVKGS